MSISAKNLGASGCSARPLRYARVRGWFEMTLVSRLVSDPDPVRLHIIMAMIMVMTMAMMTVKRMAMMMARDLSSHS